MTAISSVAERRDHFTLAAVATVKNEAAYIEEWLAYHHLVGVEHFFIYDNDSTDGLHEVLTPYVNHGLVTLLVWPLDRGQAVAYRHAAHFFGGSTRWLAFIDIDEFIVPRCDPDVTAVLLRLDPEQLVMPWRMFGFSGHRSRPTGLVMENFTQAQDIPVGGLPFVPAKAIVKTEVLARPAIHLHLTRGRSMVDARGAEVETDPVGVMKPSYEVLQLNHYYTKSEQEFAAKVARGTGSGSPAKRLYAIEEEVGYTTTDTAIARFIEPTRRHLADLRALSPKPFHYGSQLRMRALYTDSFKWHARRAIANHLHRVEKLSNSSPPIDDLGHRVRSSVVMLPAEIHPDDLGPFMESMHVHDLVRRLGASWVTRHSCDEVHEAPLVLTADDPALRRHLAVVAAIETRAATRVTWSPRTDDPNSPLTTELAEPGNYLCVAQITTAPIRADAVEIAVDSASPCAIHQIGVLSYG